MPHRRPSGFTLAELLIALAILGVIATFTIPKVLQSQQNGDYKARCKEAAAMLAGAYDAYRLNNQPTENTACYELTPYMNFVSKSNPGPLNGLQIDMSQNQTLPASFRTCDVGGVPCIQLHNGAVLNFSNGQSFGGTTTTNALLFYCDPDGKMTDGTTNGPGRSVGLFLFYNGRLTTWSGISNPTQVGGSGFTPQPTFDPPWFSWD